MVNVRTEPRRDAFRVGYLRAGALLQAKTAEPVGRDGCRGGWYELSTGGYVCNGRDVTAFYGHRLPERRAAQADRHAKLPYQYGYVRINGTPMYKRLPTDEEAAQYEGYVIPGSEPPPSAATGDGAGGNTRDGGAGGAAEPHETAAAGAEGDAPAHGGGAGSSGDPAAGATSGDSPSSQAARAIVVAAQDDDGDAVDAGEPDSGVTLEGLLGDRGSVLRRRLMKGFYVSLDRDMRTGRRRYWRTQSNGFVPYRRVVLVEGSDFHGVELDGQTWALPIGFVIHSHTTAYEKNDKGRLRRARHLPDYHDVFRIVGTETIRGRNYVDAGDGRLYRADTITRIDAQPRPGDVAEGDKWIDVDLSTQSLVAYEGDRPVYATLISSGRVINPDVPELNHATPTGTFHILSKHVATTMDADTVADGPYSIEDVPYVMYFQLAYALHSAFWHDAFGHPKSHGCVNMAPLDARWMFDWADPQVPVPWHGAYPLPGQHGTYLRIRGVTPRH